MTVEDKRGGSASEDGDRDRFPVGMRVLAVDDDPICLKVLENLLRKCQYQVTIANQAVLALKMLRENRNKFDLVISDVNMPDIDGFKLLELVGLEMDLPVIMLSAHSDTRLVMKGITHGACDYLLKPVRIEELKNIWQHVIRRKKLDSKDQNKSPNQEEACHGNGEGGQGATSTGNTDQNGNLNRKRKDQNGDEEEDDDENGHEDDETSTQKKPRVVWSVDLHRKFVACVNQLGLEKAVPKKILDLMNVEGLTRENVASHLQKYRLGLKRVSSEASQQANIVAAFGIKDSSYLRTGSLDGFGTSHSLATTGRLSNNALSSYPSAGMLGRLNSSSGLSLRAITSSGLIQPGHSQNSSNPINTLGKLQSVGLPTNQSVSLFQGIPTSLEHNQFQQSKSTTHNIIGEFNPLIDPTGFTTTTSFLDASMTVGSSGNSLTSAPSNSLLLHGKTQQIQSRGGFSSQSLGVTSLNPDSIEIGVSGSSNFMDHGRCNGSWQSAVQLSKYLSNSLPPSEPFSHDQLPANSFRNSLSSSSHKSLQCQEGFIDNVVQSMRYAPKQRWEEHKQDYNNLNCTFSTINSLVSANDGVGSLSHSMVQNNPLCSQRIDVRLFGQLNSGSPSIFQHSEVEKFSTDMTMRSNEDYLFEQTKSQDDFIQNSYDLMTAMIKREQNEDILMDGEFGFDAHSLACIQDFTAADS